MVSLCSASLVSLSFSFVLFALFFNKSIGVFDSCLWLLLFYNPFSSLLHVCCHIQGIFFQGVSSGERPAPQCSMSYPHRLGKEHSPGLMGSVWAQVWPRASLQCWGATPQDDLACVLVLFLLWVFLLLAPLWVFLCCRSVAPLLLFSGSRHRQSVCLAIAVTTTYFSVHQCKRYLIHTRCAHSSSVATSSRASSVAPVAVLCQLPPVAAPPTPGTDRKRNCLLCGGA